MGIQRGEGGDGRLCKGGTESGGLVVRRGWSLEQDCYQRGHTVQKVLANPGARSGPCALHEGRQILTGRWGLFRLSQGLSLARHKPCAYVGLSLERNHEDQDAMECGGPGRKFWWRKGGGVSPEVTVPESPGTTRHPVPGTAGPFGLGKNQRQEVRETEGQVLPFPQLIPEHMPTKKSISSGPGFQPPGLPPLSHQAQTQAQGEDRGC